MGYLDSGVGSADALIGGIDVGADAYVVKGGFEQDNLLMTIQQLL